MRIYRRTHSRLLPQGAKIVTHKGKKFARYPDRRGHIKEDPLTKKADRIHCQAKLYRISFEDNQKFHRDVEGFSDYESTYQLQKKIEKLMNIKGNNESLNKDMHEWIENLPIRIRDELATIGLLDKKMGMASKPLTELIIGFEMSLKVKERTPRYIKQTISQVKRVFAECDFRFWSDIDSNKVENYLFALRHSKKKSLSHRQSNAYLISQKGFCNWFVNSGYANYSPIPKSVKTLSVEDDKRYVRRALSPDELRLLLETAAAGPFRFGLTGPERSLLYRVGSETGFRANELRSLTVGSFDLEELAVGIKAEDSKDGLPDLLPLRPDTAAMLKEYFATKLPTTRAFAGTQRQLTDKTAEMIQADLTDAGIPVINASGQRLDFHGLRHTFITNLKNVPQIIAQRLARHKTADMLDKYMHVVAVNEREALKTLPDLGVSSTQKRKAIKTGTDDDTGTGGKIRRKSCSPVKQNDTNRDKSDSDIGDNVQKTPLHSDNRDTGTIQYR